MLFKLKYNTSFLGIYLRQAYAFHIALEAFLVRILLFPQLGRAFILISYLIRPSGLSWDKVVDDAAQVRVYLVIVGEVARVLKLPDFEVVLILLVHLLQLVALFAQNLMLLHLQTAGLPRPELHQLPAFHSGVYFAFDLAIVAIDKGRLVLFCLFLHKVLLHVSHQLLQVGDQHGVLLLISVLINEPELFLHLPLRFVKFSLQSIDLLVLLHPVLLFLRFFGANALHQLVMLDHQAQILVLNIQFEF